MSDAPVKSIAELEAERDSLRADNMTALGAVFNNLGQGLSFGFSDELSAGLAATLTNPFSSKTFDELYDQQLEIERGNLEVARTKYPKLSFAGELGGALAPGTIMYKAGMKIARNLPKLARIMGVGATEGAIYGTGIAEEGERLSGAARGAGWAAALAPPFAGVAHVVGRGVEKYAVPLVRKLMDTPKAQARREVLRALDRDEMTPHQAQLELDALGPEGVVADILGGNVQGLARTVTGRPGRARTIGETLLHNRQRGQQQRIMEAAGLSPDDIGTFKAGFYAMINNRRTQAKKFYDEAYKTLIDPDVPRKIILKTPDGDSKTITTSLNEVLEVIPKNLATKAKQLMRSDMDLLEQIKKSFPDTPEGRASAMKVLQNPDPNSFQFYDYLKRALDNRIGTTIRQGAKEEARNLMGQKKILLGVLDDISPAYRQAREIFAGEEALRGASGYGRSLMNNKVDLDEVQMALEAMSAGEKSAFRQGAIRGLVDKIEATPDTKDFARNMVNTTRMKELLSYAFPDTATFNSFIKTALAETRFSNTKNKVLGGSVTAEKLAGAADLNNNVALAQAFSSNDPVRMGIASLRAIIGQDVSEDVLEEVAHILFNRKLPVSVSEKAARLLNIGPEIRPAIGVGTAVVGGERMRAE